MKKIILASFVVCVGLMAAESTTNLKSCMSCHGQKFEKKALGKSKIVSKLSEKEIATALRGYVDGTYGGSMKGIMKMQAQKIKDPDMAAKHIHMLSTGVNPKAAEKEMCLNKLESLKECVLNAKTDPEMQKCRTTILDFAENIKTKHPVAK